MILYVVWLLWLYTILISKQDVNVILGVIQNNEFRNHFAEFIKFIPAVKFELKCSEKYGVKP